MVFESIVVELINRYLGDFVENLDRSQLKLGIWGGDVVLKNLDLKESALDELDLPVKIRAGHIANLTLKIPWKNLYTEPVVASIDGLYALAIPNIGIKYNEEKEEKAKQEAKQKKLQQIEDAKKLEAEKDKPKEEKKDSFVEKLATQVIKNLQVQVNNVHVRFEDRFTDPQHPFAIGVTLQELSFKTTDENWNPCVVKDAVTQIFKLVKLESLALYWNSNTTMLDTVPKEEIMLNLKNNVITPQHKPDYQYLIRPISSVAHLRLNTKPDATNFSIPKILLTIVFDDITVALAKLQYNDILQLLEGFERLELLSIYRKYRPDVPRKGNASTWWHFAYKSVLEETVRRRRRMWSWEHISHHRRTMKQYRQAYIQKLDQKKISAETQKKLEEGEKTLDVFSITIMRQQAEVEAAKLGAKRKEEGGGGWFGGLFGGKKKKAAKEENQIQNQLKEAYTAEEKAKLYAAIGYQENEGDITLPKEFVAVRVVTKLNTVCLAIRDAKDSQIMKVQLTDVFTSFSQRPAASAVKVEAKMDKMTVFGSPQSGITPKMVLSQTKEANKVYSLVDLLFETNPLDGACDTRINVNARPVEIIYDAVTVNSLADFFKPPEEVYLKQLSQAAMAKFEEIKEQSATGLQYAIEQRKFTAINVDLKPSCVIVPHKGFYKSDVAVLVLDLGNLKINSEKNKSQAPKERMETVEEVMLRAYDKFNIQLQSIQVLYATGNEDWRSARRMGNSNMHVLRPISIHLCLQKCMFDKDPRMAKMKVSGELPLLSLGLSDYRLQQLIDLGMSIPLPEPPDTDVEDIFAGPSTLPSAAEPDVSPNSLKKVVNPPPGGTGKSSSLQRATSQEYVNATDMELNFEIKKVEITLSQRINKQEVPMVRLLVERLGTTMKMRTFDMSVEAYLGGIYLQHLKLKVTDEGPIINIINTPAHKDPKFKLLTVSYLKANGDGPEFSTTYGNTEQSINVHFSALEVLLHLGALLGLMEFAQSLQPNIPPSAVKEVKTTEKDEAGKEKDGTVDKPKRKRKVKPKDPKIIDIKVKANLDSFGVAICTADKLITDVKIKGIESTVAVQQAKTTVAAVIRDMIVFDPSPKSLYPQILSIEGSEVLKADIVAYNGGTEGEKFADMNCVDTSVAVKIGCMKITFLNKFVTDLLAYMDHFQTAKDALKEAGETMAEKSLEQAQNIQATAARILLDIQMKAPLIVVPQSSTSSNVLCVDLGMLTLGNEFQMAKAKASDGSPAVMDQMKIELTSLKLSRGLTGNKGKIKSEVLLLDPVTLTLGIVRNLSASWYKGAPETDISGTMGNVAVGLSQGDFSVIMKLLNENLTEGQPPPGVVSKPGADSPEVKEQPVKKGTASSVSAAQGETKAITAPKIPATTDQSGSKLKFGFKLDSVSASLFSGDTEMTKEVCEHDRAKCLGKFELAGFLVEGEMMNDNSMKVKVILKDTSLEDMRPPKQNGITRMIQRSKSGSHSGSASPNMIDVSFIQAKNQDKNVDVKINSIHVCVCTEFLMSIADFFVKGMPPAPKEPPQLPIAKKGVKKAPVKEKPKLAPPPESEMSITVSLGRPDIILIEDPSSYDSNAIILETEMMFKMRVTPDATTMGGSIKDLQLYSCVFNKRDSTKTQILPPCEINLHSNAPYGQGQHMDIQMTDMILSISPATIRTLTAISSGLAPAQETEEGSKSSAVPDNLWAVKTLAETNFWFLNFTVPEAEDAAAVELEASGEQPVEEEEVTHGEQGPAHKDVLLLAAPVIVVKLEGGIGKRTVPLLIVETGFQGEVRDWSSELHVESTVNLEVAYYNEALAVWEPVLEPVHENNKRHKWEIAMQVAQNNDVLLIDEDDVDLPIQPPKMSITVKSEDILNTTITKTCLDVLSNLGKAFNDAYNLVEPTVKPGEVMSPYLIQNDTGLDLTIKLDNEFEMPPQADSGRVHLPAGKALPVFGRRHNALVRKASIIKATQEGDEKKILFQIDQFGVTREVTINRAEKKLFEINKKTEYPAGDKWAVLVSVEASYGRKTISLRSLVQVHNHMSQAVEVFYKKGEKDLVSVGRADPGKSLPLPLPALYTYTSEIYFKPVSDRYGICTNGVNWRTASESGLFPLTCATKDGHAPFYMNVNPTPEKVLFEDSSEMNRECLTLNLHPTVILHNLLPFSMSCLLEDATEEVHLDRGENYALYNASVNKSSMEFKMKYRGLQWTGRRQIQADVPELSIWTFEATNEKGEKKHLDLGLHNKQGSGTLDISLYSPYWMINKTGMPLAYRGNDAEVTLEHPADYKDIVLFSFKAKSLFSKKKDNKEKNGKGTVSEKKTKVKEMKQAGKASLKIRDSEWSDKFSLDVVGSSGTVQCKTKTGSYECGVRIDMTSSGLSKIVTFTPFYMLVNTTETTVSCKEPLDSALWLDVAPGECLPFWPQQTGKEMKLKAKVKLSDEETGPFLINTAHTTLLKLDNEYGGLDVECHVSESAMVTTIGPYKHGCASVLLVNQAENLSISFSQSGVGKTHSLGGKQAVLYTWEDALGKRELVWSCGEKKDERNDLTKDGCGDVFYLPDCKLFWVSFLDGPQRVLLFTEDMAVVGLVQKEVEYTFERIDQEINLSLRGVGLSLVNNINQTEVAFMGITSSGIIWEEKKKRYKALNLKTLVILEAAYQKYLIELAAGKSPSSRVTLENKMEVDFEEMQMYKPHKRGIRRSFVEGVWVQYKTSPHQLQLHAKINRLQFDNQLAGAVFPTVLSPLPPPKSVAADSVPKPFTEVSLMLSKHEHSHMTQIKYFKVLIQEMALKVDQGFLNAIISLFSADVPISREQETKQFEEDWKQTNLPLVEIVGVSLSHGKKNFYDHLHFSPIKVHLSFSLQGGGEDGDKPTAIQANVLNVFLQSVGVVLTDVQDVVFKLGYFERNHSFYNNSQLSSEMTSHYVGQAIKQMYVLVLGLDVLGNPFGLLRGLTEGVGDLFYEPYQGAIQGPEEFAEGLALGVRSLFGHAVGGAAGAASRITGTLGKGIAALTFDDDYQKKRRQQLNKRPANAREGFARGGKGLIMGVFDGVTGIVRKPMEGAKQEGVGGFFKGMGKGLVGVVTRPTSGVIDFASTSLDGIKRIVDLSDEIRRLRPPRRFHKDLIIRPYIHTEAEGYAILQETEKGRYVDDDYVAHAVVTKDGKNVLVVTDKRIVFASKGELLGQWNCEFTYTWVDLKEPPRVISKGIEVVLKDKEKKKFLFGGSSSKKEIHITDKKTAEWIVEKIHEQMERGR